MSAEATTTNVSLLTPLLKRIVVDPLVALVPPNVTPNMITVGGACASILGFLMAVGFEASRFTHLLTAICIATYFLADNVDGALARHRKKASKLGEFLDHWLDSLNVALLGAGMLITFHIAPGRGFVVLGLAVIAFGCAYWELRRRNILYFGYISDVEGILLIIGFYLTSAVVGPETMMVQPLLLTFTAVDLYWWIGIICCSVQTLGVLQRVEGGPEFFVLLLPIGAVVLWGTLGYAPTFWVIALLIVLSPCLSGRLLVAHLTHEKELGPRPLLLSAIVLCAAVCIVLRLAPGTQAFLISGLFGIAVANAATDFVRTVIRLRADALLLEKP